MRSDRWVLPMTLSDGQTYNMVAYLYYSGTLSDRPLQVCVHGATYDHRYWDFPSFNGRDYSYARFMVQRGYAVLALDLLAAGESERPAGDLLTLDQMASTVWRVTQGARSGANPANLAFTRGITLVGHSMGVQSIVYAQATGAGADLLIATGHTRVPHPTPVPLDFIMDALTKPYSAFSLEQRVSYFFSKPNTDPDVITYDAQAFTNNFIPRGMLRTGILPSYDPMATKVNQVTGEVLVQLGDNDALYPGALADKEPPLWTMAKCKCRSLPTVGHCFNLHIDREKGWERIAEYIKEHAQ
ncbi:MAG TPA: alpha/beta hydrolase [Myxococcales bacterium]|nr:alpha/beta hydrolase [Myxococcales bacterium]